VAEYKLVKMKNILSAFVILIILSCFQAIAVEGRLRLSSAQPTNKQNLDISTIILSYLSSGRTLHDNLELQWYSAVNLGYLSVEDEGILMLGAALGLSYPINSDFHLFSEGGFTWLDQYKFGQVGVAYKDYGGQWQFQAKVGLDYNIYKSWKFGYAYSHMSNGDRYDINPSLDTHSLYVVYQF